MNQFDIKKTNLNTIVSKININYMNLAELIGGLIPHLPNNSQILNIIILLTGLKNYKPN